VLIALGVATYLGATAAATVYGSAALYMLFHKQRPSGIYGRHHVGLLVGVRVGPDPKERKKLQLALMVPPFVLLLLGAYGHRSRDEIDAASCTVRRASPAPSRCVTPGCWGMRGSSSASTGIVSSRCPASSR
jgi:hypothetical protein